MSVKPVKDQAGVAKGYVKYQFYLRFKGQPYRRIETCRKSAVDAIYRDWEDSIINGSLQLKQYKFFQIADEYIEYSKLIKPKLCVHEAKVMRLAKEFFKNVPLNDITPKHIEDFKLWRSGIMLTKRGEKQSGKRLKPGTVNRNLATLRVFFNWALRRCYYTSPNPVFQAMESENNFREVELRQNELSLLLDEAYKLSPMFYKLILIALLTGMRRGEIFSLEWSDIQLDMNRIILSHTKTKSQKQGIVPISPMLKEIILSLKSDSRYMITGYTTDQLRGHWEKLTDILPFGRIKDGSRMRYHDLRGVYGTFMLDSGLDIVDVQHLLHHSTPVITQQRYAPRIRKDLIEKGARIDNIIPVRQSD
jgi:integrase